MLFGLISFSHEEENSYSGLSRDELLNKMSSDWNDMSDDNKIKMLQELGDRYAEENGIENKPHIVSESNPGLYGGYSSGCNEISVNLSLCDNPYEAMDTVAHEENHALQAQCIRNDTGYNDDARSVMKAQMDGRVYDTGENYDRQTLEIDSNNKGLAFVLSEHERFAEDPRLEEYYAGREQYFTQQAEDYRQNPEASVEAEKAQLRSAEEYGILTADERESAEQYLAGKNDEVRTERDRLLEEMKNVRQYEMDDGLSDTMETRQGTSYGNDDGLGNDGESVAADQGESSGVSHEGGMSM